MNIDARMNAFASFEGIYARGSKGRRGLKRIRERMSVFHAFGGAIFFPRFYCRPCGCGGSRATTAREGENLNYLLFRSDDWTNREEPPLVRVLLYERHGTRPLVYTATKFFGFPPTTFEKYQHSSFLKLCFIISNWYSTFIINLRCQQLPSGKLSIPTF